MGTPYVTIEYLKLISSMPAASVDQVEALYPGAFTAYASSVSRQVDSTLAKRYATPFEAAPEAVQFRVAHIVAYYLWNKLGYDATEDKDSSIKELKDEAEAYFRDAADAEHGFTELPRRDVAPGVNAAVRHGPLFTSTWSPYAWTDRQRLSARWRR